MTEPLLAVDHLVKNFPMRGGTVQAVRDVSFSLAPGETVGLVGESGCGKSTLGKTILRLLTPDAGSIRLNGNEIAALDRAALRPYRRLMQMVFQDPYASLNPRQTVRRTLADPLRINGVTDRAEIEARVADMLAKVGLRPAYSVMASAVPSALAGCAAALSKLDTRLLGSGDSQAELAQKLRLRRVHAGRHDAPIDGHAHDAMVEGERARQPVLETVLIARVDQRRAGIEPEPARHLHVELTLVLAVAVARRTDVGERAGRIAAFAHRDGEVANRALREAQNGGGLPGLR